jgi:hypothetical protein
MTFTKCLPDDRCKENLEHVINNISHYEKPSPLMEALVNNAGAKDLLDFYRLIEMSPGDVDSLEVTTSEGQVPLADGYKAFIRNFQGMYSVCEKQINWSDFACFWPSGGKTTKRTCASHHITPGVTLGIYQGPYPSILHFLHGFHHAI